MLENRDEVIARLRELREQHEAALGRGDAEALGFIQEEQGTRKSYKYVAQEAVRDGILTEGELKSYGLPMALDYADDQPDTPG